MSDTKADTKAIKGNYDILDIPESKEYYNNEAIALLSDTCKERDKQIRVLTNMVNYSIIINIILLFYMLLSNYYD
jgi:hypothetical protein